MRQFLPSATKAVNAEMDRSVNLGYGFTISDRVIRPSPTIWQFLAEVEKAVCEKISPYAPVGGILELREAAAC